MRLTKNRRRVLALVFAGGIGTIGSEDSDSSDGANDFTNRRGRRPLVQRPVEPDEPDRQEDDVCIIDVETTGFLPGRDAIIEIGAIRVETKRRPHPRDSLQRTREALRQHSEERSAS